MPEPRTRAFGPGFMPAWHRPWFRYITTPDLGGGDTPPAPPAPAPAADEDPEGAEALGDPGKRALDSMKTARNAAREAEREARAELAALQAQIAGKDAEHQQELERQRIKDEALATANLRIKKAELRALAAGKLSDPSDAQTFINLDEIEIDDEGNVDTAAITAALDDLLTKKPYLAAQGGSRFQGTGDGGARQAALKPPQLTEADVDRLSPSEIVKAKAEGRLDDYLNS